MLKERESYFIGLVCTTGHGKISQSSKGEVTILTLLRLDVKEFQYWIVVISESSIGSSVLSGVSF